MNDNPTPDNDCPDIDWESTIDDDPIVAEVRKARAELAAELANDFGGDWERQQASSRLKIWASGLNIKIEGEDGPTEPELPLDLSWLIPNREKFLECVMVGRCVAGKKAPDLAAFNEEGRRRARLLGYSEDAFLVSPSDFPPDVDYSSPDWLQQLWPGVEPE